MRQVEGIDELEQMFAYRKEERLAGFIKDITLAYIADTMGPGGREAAACIAGWSTQWINRLALIATLNIPDELLTPELPVGVYWLILASDLSRAAMLALLRQAVEGEWSVADTKVAMGLQPERTRGATYRAQVAAHVGRQLTLESEEFTSASLQQEAQVVVRMIK